MIQPVNIYFQTKILEYLNNIIKEAQSELRQQGHRVTGETEKSFKADVKVLGAYHFEGVILVKTSAIILNYGVSASKVPYSGGRGRGGTSKYIQALLNWAALVKPDLNDKERKSFVFAVAKKAKQEGHPTKGSYKYSSNGRRKDWIEYSIEINKDTIQKIIDPSKVLNLVYQFRRA
mgnify:CR=1 FL=1